MCPHTHHAIDHLGLVALGRVHVEVQHGGTGHGQRLAVIADEVLRAGFVVGQQHDLVGVVGRWAFAGQHGDDLLAAGAARGCHSFGAQIEGSRGCGHCWRDSRDWQFSDCDLLHFVGLQRQARATVHILHGLTHGQVLIEVVVLLGALALERILAAAVDEVGAALVGGNEAVVLALIALLKDVRRRQAKGSQQE